MSLLNFLDNNAFEWMAVTARYIGLFMFMPGISSKSIPKKVKAILAITLGLVTLNYTNYIELDSLYVIVTCIICELGAGALIGFISNLFIDVIQVIGSIVDGLLGTGMFQTVSPKGLTSVSSSIIEYTAILLFFIINGHLYIIHIVATRTNFTDLYSILTNEGFLSFIVSIIEFVLINGLSLSTPFILILLLVDLGLGIINRSFSSFNVFLFSIPVKMLLFTIMLSSYVFFFIENYRNLFNINIELLSNFISLFK